MLKSVKLTLGLVALLGASSAYADLSTIGREATAEEVHAWDHDVRPDGLGLPEGSGSVLDGEEVYLEKCASCHGDFAEGAGRWPVLAGGIGTLKSNDPNKTIGSYWPYLSTVWDYINEAMPFGDARSLEPDQIYGIVAYLMYSNDLVDEDFVLSKENFLETEMPNADGFYMDDRDEVEVPLFSTEACMSNCLDKPVEITAKAADVGVTPETSLDAQPNEEAPSEATQAEEVPAAQEVVAEEAPVEEAVAPEAAVDPELVAAGEQVFKKCKACHSVEAGKNGSGPSLAGIVGHPAGAIEGFKYSKGMVAFGEGGAVWDEATLTAFLTKPRDVVKGTKMSFAGLKEKDIAPILAYLSQQ